MTELITGFWTSTHFVLFLWSVLCFVCGMLFAVTLHYYHMALVIGRAEKMVARLQKMEEPFCPYIAKETQEHERTRQKD
jgi:hypothetical protein